MPSDQMLRDTTNLPLFILTTTPVLYRDHPIEGLVHQIDESMGHDVQRRTAHIVTSRAVRGTWHGAALNKWRRRTPALGIIISAIVFVVWISLPRLLGLGALSSFQQAHHSLVSCKNRDRGAELTHDSILGMNPASPAAQALGFTKVSQAVESLHLSPGPLGDPGAACALVRGPGCLGFRSQQPILPGTLPKGNKSCILDCNHVGTCLGTAGFCQCPVGEEPMAA